MKHNLSKEAIRKIFDDQEKIDSSLSISEVCELVAMNNPDMCTSNVTICMFDKVDQIMNPNDLDKNKKNLIIFDDCVTMKNQEAMSSYYTRRRHNNCNSIYLSQSWFDLPKKTIRNNSNFIILFKLNKRDMDLIYSDLLSNTIDKEDFYMLGSHWKKKYNYVVYNKKDDIVLRDCFID